MNWMTLGSVILAVLTAAGLTAPAMALPMSADGSSLGESIEIVATSPTQAAQNDPSVSATVGPQLSTVISVSSDEVQTGFENTAFELSVESATEEAQAEAIADRENELRDRVESIREDYADLTESYRQGELTNSEYAQRLAVLNGRANNVLTSYNQLQKRAANVSTSTLRAAEVTRSGLNSSVEDLHHVRGVGSKALFNQFTGRSDGEIALESENGFSITVKRGSGEFSREFEQKRDDETDLSVSQSAALEVAREGLSTPKTGNWVLSGSKVETSSGSYEFEFVLQNTSELIGEAEVTVDGSSGDIFTLEEETEIHENENDERDTVEQEETPEQEEDETETPEQEDENSEDEAEDTETPEQEDENSEDGAEDTETPEQEDENSEDEAEDTETPEQEDENSEDGAEDTETPEQEDENSEETDKPEDEEEEEREDEDESNE